MHRLMCLFVVGIAACGGSGFTTGEASLTNVTPAVKSASATSFTAADGNGTMVLGWTIDLFEQGPGADCQSSDVHVVASIGIFTSQTPDATHKKAMLTTGDIVIVTASPPAVNGTAAATMGVMGVADIVGTVSIATFHLKGDGTPDRIDGTINAGGTSSSSGAGVSMTGTFTAPICE